MIQYEVAKISLPPVPSALTLAGPTPNFSVPNSGNYKISGMDECPNAQNRPAVGLIGDGTLTQTASNTQADASRGTVIDALNGPGVKTNNYTGSDGCAPDAQNVNNIANPLFSTPTGLNDIVHNVMNTAQSTYSGNTSLGTANLGWDTVNDVPAPKVTVVNGDLTISGNAKGSGILLVTGTLNYSGDFSFDGVILVIGEGAINQGGGGNGDFHGAIIVANIAGTNPGQNYAINPTTDNMSPVLGSPTWNFNGGGGNGLTYNSCNFTLGLNSASYAVIARREITY